MRLYKGHWEKNGLLIKGSGEWYTINCGNCNRGEFGRRSVDDVSSRTRKRRIKGQIRSDRKNKGDDRVTYISSPMREGGEEIETGNGFTRGVKKNGQGKESKSTQVDTS